MKRVELLFYVIYSFDIPRDEPVGNHKPPHIKKWAMTEGDEEADSFDGIKDKHRKYTGLLSRKEFDDLVVDQWLVAEEIETMGSLTLEFGHLPAISFFCDGAGAEYKSAYVTPMPINPKKREHLDPKTQLAAERGWERMRRAVLSKWGN